MTQRFNLLLAVLALVAAACGSRVQQWPDEALAPADYYTETAPASSSADHGTAPTAEATPDTMPGSTKQSASKPLSGGATEIPAPAPGAYTYDETTNSPGFEGEPAETESRSSSIIWSVKRTGSEVELTSVEKEEEEDFTMTVTSTYRVRANAFELLTSRTEFTDEDPETCTYKPPILVLRLPLTVGQKWKVSSRCDLGDGESGEGDPEEEVEFEVSGTADDVIGGKKVKTFLVRSREFFDSTDDTTGERTTFSFEDTRHVDPATLLVVIEDVKFSFDGDESTTVHRQLRSLTPS